MQDQHPEEDSPGKGSGKHLWDSTSPHPGLAIEFALPRFPGKGGGLMLCFLA
jgi:hypothetical protein